MKPILVIQMQRMGDLILTFPLLLWLQRTYPGHPLWVMAEPQFAQPLKTIGPEVVYLHPHDQPRIMHEGFALIINLSHRPESHILAGRLNTEQLVGGYSRDGVTHVAGNWQEYRASVVHNNRHNRFHWADLNALDAISLDTIAKTTWPPPRTLARHEHQIGLFLGASAPDKRPTPVFWANLINDLEKRAFVPILLGGPAERDLCTEVQRLSARPVATACGRLSLDKLAFFGQELAAMITPDTGPMHLAAWSGLKVLNLSMGPVHAWETGPYQPGHVVIRSARDCVGCWHCRFESPRCQEDFTPARIATVLSIMLKDGPQRLAGLQLPGLEIALTSRNQGLFHLDFLSSRAKIGQLLGAYWHYFWQEAFGMDQEKSCRMVWKKIQANHEPLAASFRVISLTFLKSLTGTGNTQLALDAWNTLPPMIRPLSGYISLHLANHDFHLSSRKRALFLAEKHLSFLS